jgi:hypothetical protein
MIIQFFLLFIDCSRPGVSQSDGTVFVSLGRFFPAFGNRHYQYDG